MESVVHGGLYKVWYKCAKHLFAILRSMGYWYRKSCECMGGHAHTFYSTRVNVQRLLGVHLLLVHVNCMTHPIFHMHLLPTMYVSLKKYWSICSCSTDGA